MSKNHTKRIPVALLKAAYRHGQKVGRKAADVGYDWNWENLSATHQMAFEAFARYIIKHQPK